MPKANDDGDALIKKLQRRLKAQAAKMTPEQKKAMDDEYKRKYRDDFRDIEWKFDLKGHFLSKENLDIPAGKAAYEDAVEELKHHIDFSASMRDGHYSTEIKGKPHQLMIRGGGLNGACHKCGEEPKFLIDKKTKKAVAQTRCKYPKGFPEFAVEINVPSGKLIFANDLRQFYPAAVSLEGGVTGNKLYSDAYAAHGLIIVYTGNTCPGVYQKGNTLTIGTANSAGDGDRPLVAMTKVYGKRVGGICTDLWWYSAVDFDDLRKRVEDLIPTWKADFAKEKKDYTGPNTFEEFLKAHKSGFDIVSVQPGRYRATSRCHLARAYEQREYLAYSDVVDLRDQLEGKEPRRRRHAKFEIVDGKAVEVKPPKLPKEELKRLLAEAEARQKAIERERPGADIYSVITRVGACGRIKANERNLKLQQPPTFEEYILISRLTYPSIYPTRNTILDHTFCTIGNGLEWVNGSLYQASTKAMEARRQIAAGVKVTFDEDPKFDGHFELHDTYSRLTRVPDDVRPDWLKGVLEVLDLVLKRGPDALIRESRDTKGKVYRLMAKESYEIAKMVKADLIKRFAENPAYSECFPKLPIVL